MFTEQVSNLTGDLGLNPRLRPRPVPINPELHPSRRDFIVTYKYSLGGSLARNLPFGGVSNYELLNTENTNLSSLIERFENNGFIEHFRRHRRDIQIDLNPAFSKQYYDVDEFNLKFSRTNCGLTICHINVRRIAKNKGRLIAFLS